MKNEVRRLSRGEVVFRQGELADALFILREGRVAVEVEASGAEGGRPRRVVLAEIADPGAVVGEAGFFVERRMATVRAVEEGTVVELLGFEGRELRQLLEARPDTGLKLCRSLALRLANVNEQIRAAAAAAGAVELLRSSLALALGGLVDALEKTAPRGFDLDGVRAALARSGASGAERRLAPTPTESLTPREEPGLGPLSHCEAGQVVYRLVGGGADLLIGGMAVARLGEGELIGVVPALLDDSRFEATAVRLLGGARLEATSAAALLRTLGQASGELFALGAQLSRRIEEANALACQLVLSVEGALDGIAGSSSSLEALFRALSGELSAEGSSGVLAERAASQAERARSARSRIEETFRLPRRPPSSVPA